MTAVLGPIVAERGDEPAIIDDRGTTSWVELDSRVTRLVHALRARGLVAGDAVVTMLGNQSEFIEASLACAHAGWLLVPVNWHLVAREVAYVIDDASADAVITDERWLPVVLDALALAEASSLRARLVIDASALPDGFESYEDALASSHDGEIDDAQRGGPMFYTSGTTGFPKGVRSTLSTVGGPPEMLTLIAHSMAPMIGVTPGGREVQLVCGPIYHSAQWAFSFFPMIGGSTVVMQHKYDSAAMLQMIDRYSCTNVHLVPTQMKRLLDLPDEVKNEFSGASLTTVWHGAAPCPPAVKRGLIEWWGPKITEYYGSTEGSIISTVSSAEWLAKGGSVGKPLDSVEVIVVNDESERVAQGQEGTLYFKNKMGTDFTYHNDEAKTRDSHLEPGVFTTGDVGYIDADGYLWLSDRKIDMIISGGVNIYPAEIEGVIAAHPAVEDVAVIGVPDEEFGESVKALVQVAEGVSASPETAQAIIAHCREFLAGYKAPRSVDFVQHIPRTGTGKIQKQPLRAPYWEGHQRRI